MWYSLLLFGLCIQVCRPQIESKDSSEVTFEIVGIFNRKATTQLLAFNESMHHINIDKYRLKPYMIEPKRTDSYSTWREFCASSSSIRPIAVFGPQDPVSDGVIRDQCALANIPHIQATWQPMDPDLELNDEPEDEAEILKEEKTDEESNNGESDNEESENEENKEEENNNKEENVEENTEETEKSAFKKITINFFPDSQELALAYGKLLQYYKWEKFAAVYEDNYGLMRVQKILHEITDKSSVTVHKLDPVGDNRNVFKKLAKYQVSRILIDCHASRTMKYINEAKDLKLVAEYFHYILVSMDTSTVAESLIPLPSNFTWLSLTEYDKLMVGQHDLAPRVAKWVDKSQSTSVASFDLEALFLEDIANHIMKAVNGTIEETDIMSTAICDSDKEPWAAGATLQEKILNTTTVGVTGNIAFDDQGRRKDYVLYVNEILGKKRSTVGVWDSANGDAIIPAKLDSNKTTALLSSKHFIVMSRKAEPYFLEKPQCDPDKEECDDEDPDMKYEGFAVDLVKNIFAILKEENYNYTYEFVYKEGIQYGKLNDKTKKWSGLIGELLDKTADLAVCDLTITEERKKVVDFSVPFMSLGISILYTQERKISPGWFSFLNPYTVDVWMYTATAYCGVSLILFICARISPADWENPEPCDKDPEELENIWTFKNCVWLTMGSIMTQGCDILPKAFGTRWVCAMWWFFAVIVCQTYIAQLSASMTSALENEPINSVDDLAKQTKIKYGVVDGGSTLEFFKSSSDKTFRRMYDTMIANPALLVETNDEGEKRVLTSRNKFAFFMESCTIEYKLNRNCDLKQVGGLLDSKDYGIAMPANSPYRTDINRAILRMKEQTVLDKIKKKWWNEKECNKKTDDTDVEGDLEWENLVGAFVVLMVGLVFCLVITAIEFMNEVRNIVVREQVTHKEVFIKELKASLNFFQLQKPVLRNPSRAPSVISGSSDDKREKRTSEIDDFLMEKDI